MEEDSITLNFQLANPKDFNVGDYIQDAVFGRFTISEDPLPADYDPKSGAYKYELRFDADWILWKNKVFMLTYGTGTTITTSGNDIIIAGTSTGAIRKETEWVLTDNLQNHLAVLIDNLTAIGYVSGSTPIYSASVHTQDIADTKKAVCITYSGTSILDALKTLADSYECEFWVANNVIHFGKCEVGSVIDLSMNDDDGRTINVENIVPSRAENEYGTRFYVYGSTKNIPETYRKHLSFKVDTVSGNTFKDSVRPIYADMLTPRYIQNLTPEERVINLKWTIVAYQRPDSEIKSDEIPVIPGDMLSVYMNEYLDTCHVCYNGDNGVVRVSLNVLVQVSSWYVPAGVTSVWLESECWGTQEYFPHATYTDYYTKGYYATMSWSRNGTAQTTYVKLVGGSFVVVDAIPESTIGQYQNLPTGFTTGTEFALNYSANGSDGLRYAYVPYSYYTDDDEKRMTGERRLMLPLGTDYIQPDGSLTREEIVERVVLFDEIYPKCALRVTSVEVGEYDATTQYSDGSRTASTLPAYTIQAKRIDGSSDVDFPFDPKTMMSSGQKLQATFLTPDETKSYSGKSTENVCLLMGMTFDVACNRSGGVTTYQLAWNKNYGDKLPNDILMPKVGDAFILSGWNPVAMGETGIISSAETLLQTTATTYAQLVREAQFTFDCSMMSDWILNRCTYSTDHYLPDGLLPMGQKVKVYHDALAAGYLVSRVIGFEYKLDIPYDTPVYTIGETEAYSRMREIEKSLHAQSQSTSSASNTGSSSLSGGGTSSSGGGKPLHLSTGTMSGMNSVDYDGSKEESFRVPSVLDHLMDSDRVPRIGDTSGGITTLVDKDGNTLQLGSFFELVEDTSTTPHTFSIKVKDTIGGNTISGLWATGWISAGGVGTGGGGGGGGSVTYLNDLSDVTAPNPGNGDLLTWDASANSNQGAWVNVARNQVGTPVSLTNGATYSTLTVNSVTADFYTKAQVDSALANIDLSAYVTQTALSTTLASYVTQSALTTTLADYATKAELAEVNTLVDITTLQDGILKFEWQNGDIVNVDLNHEHSNYVPITTTINGVDLSQSRTFYVGKTAIQGVSQSQALQGILSVKETDASSLFEWEASTGAWRFHGNLYADGWIAAGGIGNSSGGGGGVSSFYDLPEIGIDSSTTILTNQVLTYNGTAWVNQTLGVSVSNTIPDGTTGYTRVATITINGTSVNINAPADGGGGGGSGTETDPIFSASAAFGITTSDITAWNSKLSGVMMNGSTVTPTNGVVNLGTVLTAVPDLSSTYVTLSGAQTITGAKTFSAKLSVNADIAVNGIDTIQQNSTDGVLLNYGGKTAQKLNAYGTEINLRAFNSSAQANILSVQTDRVLVGSQLIPNYTTGLNLGGSSSNQRWSTIYGLNANLTGNLVMSSTSYIDLGPVRIEYDSVNKAIHITKVDSNDNNEYGFYCDGFVAAGGVQASS